MKIAIDQTVNICEHCNLRQQFPECCADDVVFGIGYGLDNIISCDNFDGDTTILQDELCSKCGELVKPAELHICYNKLELRDGE
jgi:hypothetical protein